MRNAKDITAEIYGLPPFKGPGLKHGRNQTGEAGPCEPNCRKCWLEAQLATVNASIEDTLARQRALTVFVPEVIPQADEVKQPTDIDPVAHYTQAARLREVESALQGVLAAFPELATSFASVEAQRALRAAYVILRLSGTVEVGEMPAETPEPAP